MEVTDVVDEMGRPRSWPDVYRDFSVIAICEGGKVRWAGRVPSSPEGSGALAESLLPSDRYERTRARRGHGKAIVASARKLAVLFWCMLTRSEDCAHQQPSLTAKKLRKLDLKAGAPRHTEAAAGVWSGNRAIRHAERQLRRASRGLLQAAGPRPAS